jgi:hypothetical protein
MNSATTHKACQTSIVSKVQVKHRVRSDKFIQWYHLWKSSDYLYEMVAGKSRVGNKQRRGRERQRESRVKEWETEHGEDQKWRGLEMTVGNDTRAFGD